MADQWYYGRGSLIFGPVSGVQLAGLAAGGEVRPTDTVWKDGVEAGVPANKVKHLFRAATPPGPAAEPAGSPPGEAVGSAPAAAGPVPVAGPPPMPALPPAKRARATAGKGALIVGQ